MFVLMTGFIQAQTDNQELIRQQLQHDNQKLQLETTYKSQLSNYRDLEKKYQISLAEYYQLETLSALEKAIQDTKSVMITRNSVLLSYLRLLRLELTDTHGIKIEDKKSTLEYLLALEEEIQLYDQDLAATEDRIGLEQKILEFRELNKNIEQLSHLTLSLIKFGRLQTVYDQTIGIFAQVSTRVEERNSGILLAEKKRALNEIELDLVETKEELSNLYLDVFNQEKKNFGRSSLTNFTKDLEPIYSQLVRIHDYIQEVL